MRPVPICLLAISLFVTCSLVTIPAQATITDNVVGQITTIFTYTDYGTGDVVIQVQSAPAACQHGYWIRMTDVGAKTVYAQLLAAYHTKTPMRVGGYDDQLWAGSSGKYCRIYFVGAATY